MARTKPTPLPPLSFDDALRQLIGTPPKKQTEEEKGQAKKKATVRKSPHK
jgi:hypothetical protein